MKNTKRNPKYPENLQLKGRVIEQRIKIKDLAISINYSRKIVTDTLNGDYKGTKVVAKIESYLNSL
ncbi:MAG: hypothetical protein IE931_05720 [Sphingobacteriales bacterium]|nr:hypothetical protein [Sphingobacteriales bacterium]